MAVESEGGVSDTAACDAESCNTRPDPRCPYCLGKGRVDVSEKPKPPRQGALL